MLSIHSPNYVFTVLVCILMKTHNHFWVPSQCYKYVFTAIYGKSDGVLCFHYSRMRIATYVQTFLRLRRYVSALRCYCWCMLHFFVAKKVRRIMLLTPGVINAKPGHNGTNPYSTCLWLYQMLLNMVTTVPNSPSNLRYHKIWSQYSLEKYCGITNLLTVLHYSLLTVLSVAWKLVSSQFVYFHLPWVGVQQLHQ